MQTATADKPLSAAASRGYRVAVVSTELFGSGDLLTALGWKPNLFNFLRLSAAIGAAMFGFLALTVLIGVATPISPLILQVLLWAGWLTWLGYVLPRHRSRDLAAGGNVFRRAFWRELCLGIGFNFAMILRPAVVGIVEGGAGVLPSWVFPLGLLLSGAGLYAILDASRQLGVSCAFFVYEYSRETTPPVVDGGIYGWLRHPLFTGGICMSAGLGLCVGTPPALALSALNVAVLLPYLAVEDHRCKGAVGDRYARYREEVGGIIPRRRRGSAAGEPSQAEHGSDQHQRRERPADQERVDQVGTRQP